MGTGTGSSAILQATDGTWKAVWPSQFNRVGCVDRIRVTECECGEGFSTNSDLGFECYPDQTVECEMKKEWISVMSPSGYEDCHVIDQVEKIICCPNCQP